MTRLSLHLASSDKGLLDTEVGKNESCFTQKNGLGSSHLILPWKELNVAVNSPVLL